MPSQQDRHELHLALERELGHDPAATLMELLPPFDWSEIARRSDIAGVRAEVAGTKAELKNDIADVKGDIARLDAKIGGLDAKIGGLDARIDGVEAKLAGLDAKIESQVAKTVLAMIPVAFSAAGLVIAAAKLL